MTNVITPAQGTAPLSNNVADANNVNHHLPYANYQPTMAGAVKPADVFATPMVSSPFVQSLLDSPLGSWLGGLEDLLSSIANEVIPRKSTEEHIELMQHYYNSLQIALANQKLETKKQADVDIASLLTQYLIQAKVLTERGILPKRRILTQLKQLQGLAQFADIKQIDGNSFDDVIASLDDNKHYQPKQGIAKSNNNQQNGLFPAVLPLSILDGDNGFQVDGVAANDNSGFSVSAAGDINGDGVDDVIIGAYGADPNGGSSGSSYVVFGQTGGFNATLPLSKL